MCTLGFVSDGCFLVLHLFGALYKRIIERITAPITIRSKITYYVYVGFCFGRVFPCSSSIWCALIKAERIAAAIQIRSEIVNAIRSSAVLFSSQHKNKTAVLLFERKRIVAKVRFWVWTFCILFYKIVL